MSKVNKNLKMIDLEWIKDCIGNTTWKIDLDLFIELYEMEGKDFWAEVKETLYEEECEQREAYHRYETSRDKYYEV